MHQQVGNREALLGDREQTQKKAIKNGDENVTETTDSEAGERRGVAATVCLAPCRPEFIAARLEQALHPHAAYGSSMGGGGGCDASPPAPSPRARDAPRSEPPPPRRQRRLFPTAPARTSTSSDTGTMEAVVANDGDTGGRTAGAVVPATEPRLRQPSVVATGVVDTFANCGGSGDEADASDPRHPSAHAVDGTGVEQQEGSLLDPEPEESAAAGAHDHHSDADDDWSLEVEGWDTFGTVSSSYCTVYFHIIRNLETMHD